MLQIITGKFFVTDKLYTTQHRGVLYTNYENMIAEPIITAAGTLCPVSTMGDIGAYIYEVDQRLEAVDSNGKPEALVAVNLDSYIEDFAVVASFALNATFTANVDLARRLTQSNHPASGISKLPHEYVGRVFDRKVPWSSADAQRLTTFVEKLVGLERKDYNAVMRAVRRHVHGLHRIADDLDLAYSLLVASIESLAQDFDDFALKWDDYAQDKRQDFDKALKEAPSHITDAVRATILKHEHIALRRRYQEFALRHLKPAFFREDAQREIDPIRRCDVPIALENAYKARSSYIHNLRELPDMLTSLPHFNDTIQIANSPQLTFHGLARLGRQIILDVVESSPKVDRELFNYRAELPNIVHIRMAEQCWIWQATGYNRNSARMYLNGFLNQLGGVMAGIPGAALTDIRPVLTKIEELVPGLAKSEQRRPLLLLYILFHRCCPKEYYQSDAKAFVGKYQDDFRDPSLEMLILSMLTYQSPEWSLEQYMTLYSDYLKQRYKKNALQLSPLFEAALTLFLAEIHLEHGDKQTAYVLVSGAVENLPKHQSLRNFEATIVDEVEEIDWRKILLPSTTTHVGADPMSL